MDETKNPKDEWRLQKIEIEFQRWGEHTGKYAGKIQFENGEYESFSFKLRPEMAEPYIKLMSKDIVESAESLGTRLIESLGIKKE